MRIKHLAVRPITSAIFCSLLFLSVAQPCHAQPRPSSAKAAPVASPKPTSKSPLAGDFGNQPTFVKSDSLTLKSEKRIFTYTGNVEARQGDMTITCDTLEGTYTEQNKIATLTARSNVVIVKGPTIRAQGERADYQASSETIVLTENPELQQEGSVLTADLIRIYLKEDRSEAEGAVRVKLVKKEEQKGKK
jgi:lipopolysaccharide export system protein LptA